MTDTYAWARGREGVVRMGPAESPTILILPPLFEEANRTRRILVEVMRGLAASGLASALPDLPGTSDSIVATVDARFADWAEAVGALAATLPRPLLTIAIRGGCLLDGFAKADAAYRLSPETGARLLRDMLRASALTAGVKIAALTAEARVWPTRLAGNLIHPALFEAIDAATPAALDARCATIGDKRGDSDVAHAGAPPWRTAEPGDDPQLVRALVYDIADWAKTCAVN